MIVLALSSLFCIISSVSNYLPTFAQMVVGTSVTVSGFLAAPGMLIGIFASAIIGNQIAKRQKYKGILLQWAFMCVIACVMYLAFGSLTPIWFLFVPVTIICVAQSYNQVAPMAYPSSVLTPTLIATGIAFISFSSSLANTVGNALFGAVINAGMENLYKLPIAFAAIMIIAAIAFRDAKAEGSQLSSLSKGG
jgi:hypothetical protein